MDKDLKPKVTILMGVYNSAEYLREAIDSILNQSYKDFEFLIIEDGSSDDSLKIIKSYSDKRIRLVINKKNLGLSATLNKGLKLARGEYLARQDSDDVSTKERLQKEVAFLDDNKVVDLVGSNYIVTDSAGKSLVTTNVFTHPDDLKVALITCNQYGHGSIMLRTKTALKLGGYDTKVGHVEDYDLWVRISQVAKVANIEEPLYRWRKNEQSISHQNAQLQIDQTFAVRDRAFEHFLKNRRSYKIFGNHPSGNNYRIRKALLCRDFAYLYRAKGRTLGAIKMLLLAIFWRPQNRRNYRLLAKTILKPSSPGWEYEFL